MAYYQGGVQPSQLDVSGLAHGIRGRLQQMDAMGLAEVNQYGLPSLAWRAKQGDQAAIRTLRRMGYANWQRLVPTLREDGRGFEAPPGVPWDLGQRNAFELATFGLEPETETTPLAQRKKGEVAPPPAEETPAPPVVDEEPPVAVAATPPATAVTPEDQVTPPVTTPPVVEEEGGFRGAGASRSFGEDPSTGQMTVASFQGDPTVTPAPSPQDQRKTQIFSTVYRTIQNVPREQRGVFLDPRSPQYRNLSAQAQYLGMSAEDLFAQVTANLQQEEQRLRGMSGGGIGSPGGPRNVPPMGPPETPATGAPWQNPFYTPSAPPTPAPAATPGAPQEQAPWLQPSAPAPEPQRPPQEQLPPWLQGQMPEGFLEQVGGRTATPQADFSPYTLDEAQAYAEQRGETPAAVYEQTIDPKTGAMRPTLQIGDSDPIPIKNAEQDRIAREVTALLDEPEGSPRQQFAQAALKAKIRTEVRPALQQAAKELKTQTRETGRMVPVSDYARRVAAFIEQDPAAAVQYFLPQATAVLDARGKEATADYQGALAGEARARARIAGIEATAAEQLGDEFARRRALAQVEQMEIGNRILQRQYDFMPDRENAELKRIWAETNMTDEQRKLLQPYYELAVAAQEFQELLSYAGAQAGVSDNMKFLFEALKSGIFADNPETQATLMATFMTGATGLNYDPVVIKNLWNLWRGRPGVKLSDVQAGGQNTGIDPNAGADADAFLSGELGN